MPHKWNFEIRNTVVDYPAPHDNDPNVQRTYDHINAMCFLLDGIPYSVVYGPAKLFAEALLQKLAAADPGELNRVLGPHLPRTMATELLAIVNVAGSDAVHMSTLYTTQFTSVPETTIVGHFQAIKNADSSGLLCMPFLLVQNGTHPPVPTFDMAQHVGMIGGYTLFDIYTKSKKFFPALAAAVQHGRNIGAMGYAAKHLMEVMSPVDAKVIPPLNNRICSGGVCVTNNGTWCNVDSNGNCTTG